MSNISSVILQKNKQSLVPDRRNTRKTLLLHIQNIKTFTISSFLGKIFIECIDGFLKNSLLCLHLFEVCKHRFHLRLILHKKVEIVKIKKKFSVEISVNHCKHQQVRHYTKVSIILYSTILWVILRENVCASNFLGSLLSTTNWKISPSRCVNCGSKQKGCISFEKNRKSEVNNLKVNNNNK